MMSTVWPPVRESLEAADCNSPRTPRTHHPRNGWLYLKYWLYLLFEDIFLLAIRVYFLFIVLLREKKYYQHFVDERQSLIDSYKVVPSLSSSFDKNPPLHADHPV